MTTRRITAKYCRILIIVVTVVFLFYGVTTAGATSQVELPPGFEIKWNIAEKDSKVVQEFTVTEYHQYTLWIIFRAPTAGPDGRTVTSLMHVFTGDGQAQCYTKESVNTAHPVVVPANTPEEIMRRTEGVRNGIYVWKATNPGVTIPVHIRIEHVDQSGTASLHTETIKDTEGTVAAGRGGLLRVIARLTLKPGQYRLVARTVRASEIPGWIEAAFMASLSPNTAPPSD